MAHRALWGQKGHPGWHPELCGDSTRHIQSSHPFRLSGPAAPSSLPVPSCDSRCFPIPQPSGERAESTIGMGRSSSSSIPRCFPSQFLGSPGLELPGLCPAWQQGCGCSFAIPRFAVGANSCLAPHVPTSHPCSDCQGQHMENLCGFGEGLLSLHSWGPILVQQVQACSISGHGTAGTVPLAPWVWCCQEPLDPTVLILGVFPPSPA